MFLVAFINTSETKLRLYDKVQCRAGSASQTSNRRPNGISIMRHSPHSCQVFRDCKVLIPMLKTSPVLLRALQKTSGSRDA